MHGCNKFGVAQLPNVKVMHIDHFGNVENRILQVVNRNIVGRRLKKNETRRSHQGNG